MGIAAQESLDQRTVGLLDGNDLDTVLITKTRRSKRLAHRVGRHQKTLDLVPEGWRQTSQQIVRLPLALDSGQTVMLIRHRPYHLGRLTANRLEHRLASQHGQPSPAESRNTT